MNLSLMIYLMSIADDINVVCSAGIIILPILASILIVITIFLKRDEDDGAKVFFKYFKKTCWILAFFSTLGILVPDSKEIAAMYLIPKIVNNEQVSQLPEKALKLFNVKLDSWIDDLGEKK